MNNVIRVGIIGQGRSGRDIHGAFLSQDTSRYRIVAVADPIELRRQRAEADWGCQSHADYRDLMARRDLDLVINASPSNQHVPISLELLQTGHNVVCEKPLARTASEVDALSAAVQTSGKFLTAFQNSRFAPYFRQVHRVIDSGVLGRVVQITIIFSGFSRRWDWQTLQEFNGGSLMNTGPHPLDMALDLFGEGMPKVTCYMDRANTRGDAEDYVKLLLGGPPGRPVVDLEISSCCAYPHPRFNIQATCGGLEGGLEEMTWRYFVPSEAPLPPLERKPIAKPDGSPAYCSETLAWRTEQWAVSDAEREIFSSSTGAFYRALHDSLAHGKAFPVTLDQIRRQIAVIEEARKQNPHIYR